MFRLGHGRTLINCRERSRAVTTKAVRVMATQDQGLRIGNLTFVCGFFALRDIATIRRKTSELPLHESRTLGKGEVSNAWTQAWLR